MVLVCRLFGTKCDKCGLSFSRNDFVMRAKTKIYHIECFRCSACERQLIPGDEFALREDGLFCKEDHEVLEKATNSENNNNTTNVNNNNNSSHNNNNEGSNSGRTDVGDCRNFPLTRGEIGWLPVHVVREHACSLPYTYEHSWVDGIDFSVISVFAMTTLNKELKIFISGLKLRVEDRNIWTKRWFLWTVSRVY